MRSRDRRPSRFVLVSVVLAGIAFGFAGPTRARAKKPNGAKVEAGLEAESREVAESYMTANLSIVAKTVPEAVKRCAAEHPDGIPAAFEVVVRLDPSGKPKEVTPEPAVPFASCVAKGLESASFTPPPIDPAVVHFDVSMTY